MLRDIRRIPKGNSARRTAQGAIEYMVMIALIFGALAIFSRYIIRAISGRWKIVADSYDYGRGYDPERTMKCDYDYVYTNRWYNVECFEEKEGDCASVRATRVTCQDVIKACPCSPQFTLHSAGPAQVKDFWP